MTKGSHETAFPAGLWEPFVPLVPPKGFGLPAAYGGGIQEEVGGNLIEGRQTF